MYAILDIRRKLENGQAYLEVIRDMSGRSPRGFPPGARSRMVVIRLTINNFAICYAHQYVSASGIPITRPDPKWIRVDDLILKQ